jgi:multiple sugar transport system substrate-binding protein
MADVKTRRDFLRRGLYAVGLVSIGSSLLAACSQPAAAPTAAPAAPTAAPKPTTAPAAAPTTAPTAAPKPTTAPAAAPTVAPTTAAAAAPTAPPAANAVSVGSNYSDAVPKKAMQDVFDAFTKKSGVPLAVNTVDHNTFQEQINTYLQGKPDDVFSWFAGYRMQFFAAQGLSMQIDDVWQKVGSNYSDAMKAASTGADGHQYFIPIYNYPWAVFYRKSLFSAKGYTVPKTMDDLKGLSDKMKADGITPFAFADKQGWPAMGTFDILNMRINGYDFHVNLMAGKEKWTDDKVNKVFTTWRDLLPYHQDGALGRDWQDAAQTLVAKTSGMMLLGTFIGQQFTNKADYDDLDFFPYPQIDAQWGQDSIDAPIDGFMLSKSPKQTEGAKQFLQYLSTGEAQMTYLASDPTSIAAAKDAKTDTYTPLQKKAQDVIGSSKHIAQFMDRDTRPDFASTVMIPSIQQFLQNPQDIDGLLKSIEDQKNSIFIG